MFGFTVEYPDIGGRIAESGPTVYVPPATAGGAALAPPRVIQALAFSFVVALAWARIDLDPRANVREPVPLRIVIVAVRFLFFAVR